eukprot:TRINITY_DN1070_c0_g1_i1.p1 TRINITY_DN1070_c0_g1~~TRINITY_DN1070_c0_g1_i1.p1  ORF type:complete len:749 (+),score=253.74 TRINITY_DN1070_c0_g1_i1:425-2671(+)
MASTSAPASPATGRPNLSSSGGAIPSGPAKVKTIGMYRLGRTLGQGSYGKVKLGTHLFTGVEVAIKIMKPHETNNRAEVDREIAVLKLLQHPNIVRLFEVIEDEPTGRIYLVLELVAGGELFDYIVARGRIKEKEARKFFRQMISGVEYCHANLVIHRDLKPENLLIDAEGNVKINDFGFSNLISPGKLFSTFCGSPIYAPPEIILEKEYVGQAVDIWSMGVILYALVNGQLPWRLGKNGRIVDIDRLLAGQYEHHPTLLLSKGAKDLMSRMIVPDPKLRATLAEVRNHPWLCEEYDGPPPCLLPPRPPVEKVNDTILQQLVLLGYNKDAAKASILANNICPVVTTYHLLLEKAARVNANVPGMALSPNMGHRRGNSNDQDHNSSSSGTMSAPNTPPSSRPRPLLTVDVNAEATQQQQSSLAPRPMVNDPRRKSANNMDLRRLSLEIKASEYRAPLANAPAPGSSTTTPSSSATQPPKSPNAMTGSGGVPLVPIIEEPSSGNKTDSSRSTLSPIVTKRTRAHTTTASLQQAQKEQEAQRSAMLLAPPSTAMNSGAVSPNTRRKINLLNIFKTKKEASAPTIMMIPVPTTPPSSITSDESITTSTTTSTTPSTPQPPPSSNSPAIASPQKRRLSFTDLPGPWKSKQSQPKDKSIRTIKGVFNVDTTTMKTPDQIVAEITRVLGEDHIEFKHKGYTFKCKQKQADEKIQFDMEICQLEGLNMNGVRFKRISGGVWPYRNTCQTLIANMKL